MEIYVGNLSWSVADEELAALFAAHGAVERAKVMMDRETNRSRGFGFVTMKNNAEATAAIAALNGAQHQGRALRVNQAQERAPRTGGPADRPPGGGYRGDANR